MDESLATALYAVIGLGLMIVLIYAGRQFVAGLQEAKREHDARAKAQESADQGSAAAQVVRRRRG